MLSLAQLAQRSAHLDPRTPALIDPQLGVSTTFGALDDRTELLALALRTAFDCGVGGRIAALSRNCSELIELYLASARAGTLLFPLNWRFSASQVKDALQDAHPIVVFYEHEFRPLVEEIQGDLEVQFWIEFSPGKDSEYEELLVRARTHAHKSAELLPDPATLWYQPYLAISTGGTTGIAKSAVHSQFSYGTCILDYLAAARIAESDVYMMLGQLFHVAGYMPLAYLAKGRPAVIMDFETDMALEVIREERVTGFFAIATMLPRLVNALKAGNSDVSSVRLVEYGGAPMGEEVIREAASLFRSDLLQAWGMTEFGPGTYLGPEAHRRALDGECPELLRSCGTAALFSTVAILGEDGQAVPRDSKTMGEICHRGPNNMISYWNKPAETESVMCDGWIHTGDGGTWNEEGFIFIVDRIKSMIISGGENIFPAEIERLLANHPDIAEVVVIGVPDNEWGEVVKAVVVRSPGAELTEQAVAQYVEDNLASYKKPRLIDFVDVLPMTPTGKINRALLRENSAPVSPS